MSRGTFCGGKLYTTYDTGKLKHLVVSAQMRCRGYSSIAGDSSGSVSEGAISAVDGRIN